MKLFYTLSTIILVGGFFFLSCNEDEKSTDKTEKTNTAPKISEAPNGMVNEGDYSSEMPSDLIVTVTATDEDNDTLTYKIQEADVPFVIGSSDGIITATSNLDFETKSNYDLTIEVSDGTDTNTKMLTITVGNINDNAPMFTSTNTATVDEGDYSSVSPTKEVITITATDTDGDALTTLSYAIKETDVPFSIDDMGKSPQQATLIMKTKMPRSLTP